MRADGPVETTDTSGEVSCVFRPFRNHSMYPVTVTGSSATAAVTSVVSPRAFA